jgi:hypothetical protein
MGKGMAAALFAAALAATGLPGLAAAEDNDNGLTEEERQQAVEFVQGNAMFVMLHETGHMLVSELKLPVLGREEDAVDTLSSLLLLEADDETLDKAISDSADAWYLSGEAADQAETEVSDDSAFWDTHGLDKQRAFHMMCMMVGKDAERFKDYADYYELPQERREECKGEYQQALQSWNAVLAPHALEEGQKNTITVSYEEPSAELAPYAKLLKDFQLLENVADVFSELYKLDDGIQFLAGSCGQPNAFWMPGERKLVFCYELAAYHDQLITKWLIDNRDEGEADVSDAGAATEEDVSNASAVREVEDVSDASAASEEQE